MRKDSPLAEKESIALSDLKGQPLIIPRQPNHNSMFLDMLGIDEESVHITAPLWQAREWDIAFV